MPLFGSLTFEEKVPELTSWSSLRLTSINPQFPLLCGKKSNRVECQKRKTCCPQSHNWEKLYSHCKQERFYGKSLGGAPRLRRVISHLPHNPTLALSTTKTHHTCSLLSIFTILLPYSILCTRPHMYLAVFFILSALVTVLTSPSQGFFYVSKLLFSCTTTTGDNGPITIMSAKLARLDFFLLPGALICFCFVSFRFGFLRCLPFPVTNAYLKFQESSCFHFSRSRIPRRCHTVSFIYFILELLGAPLW